MLLVAGSAVLWVFLEAGHRRPGSCSDPLAKLDKGSAAMAGRADPRIAGRGLWESKMPLHSLSDQFLPVKTDLLQDASEYRLAVQGWHMDCQQISAGQLKSKLTQVSLGHVQVIRVRTNRAMMNRGVCWPGSIVFSLLLAASGPSRACGHEIFVSSDLIACETDLPELLTPDEFDLLTLAIDKKWFATKA